MSLSWRWMVSPTLTNEMRGGFMLSDTSFLDSNKYPAFLLSTTNLLFNSPVNTFLNQGRTTNTYSIQDNATWMKGKHEVSFGFQSQILHTNAVQRRRHHPHLYAGHQQRQHHGADGGRPARHPLFRPDHGEQPVREPGGNCQHGGADLQRHQHDLRLRPGRHQPAPTDAEHVGRAMCRTSGGSGRTSP